MTQIIQDVIRGSLKVNDLPDRVCIRDWRQLIESIPQFMTVEVPASASGIIIGATAPGDDDINKLWLRRENSGAVLGLYAFQGGSWNKIYNVIQDSGNVEIRWLGGVSTSITPGWILIEENDAVLTSNTVQKIRSEYVPSSTPGVFNYFAVRYVGY